MKIAIKYATCSVGGDRLHYENMVTDTIALESPIFHLHFTLYHVIILGMELEYTYFEAEDGFFVGWFDRFPEDVTQGKSLEELEEMLADMYECLNLAKYHKRKLLLA